MLNSAGQGFHLSENKYTDKRKKTDKVDKNPENEKHEILENLSTLGLGG
jgi:hypothetical protein